MAMTNGYLMRYYEDCSALLKTMLVKHEASALLMNEKVAATYGVDAVNTLDPTTWKYYMNAAGEYHPTDTLMRVVSIDTLEEIDFTASNLLVHSATKQDYQYGTRSYYALLKQYPEQELLINGILNPANKEEMIAAPNGTIVSYRKDLVESNEITLIASLELFFKRMFDRWYVQQFNIPQELYHVVMQTAIQMHGFPKLLNLRSRRCHTYEVHSFHVRMFLASHSELDRYLPFLTLKQSLWLYRNIRYLERNSGKRYQFAELIDKLLTDRGIPIGEYNIRQLDKFDGYKPETKAVSNPLNPITNFLTDPTLEVKDLFIKEIPDAPGNQQFLDARLDTEDTSFAYSPDDTLKTKVLHSSMVDLENAVPETFEEIALRQWCHMSMNGLYTAYVTFQDPKTANIYSITAKDAFLYMWYLQINLNGTPMSQFPDYLNIRRRRHPKPTVEDLLSVTDARYELEEMASLVLSRQPALTQCVSVTAFNALIYQLYDEAVWHWFLRSRTEDYYKRAQVENMINRLYATELTVLDTGLPSIGHWLVQNNLPHYDYTRAEAELLAKVIFEQATGRKLDSVRSMANIQKAMIELLRELSSYTLQFVRDVNVDDVVIVDWPTVRVNDPEIKLQITIPVPVDVILLDSTVTGNVLVDCIAKDQDALKISADMKDTVIETKVDVLSQNNIDFHVETSAVIDLSNSYLDLDYPDKEKDRGIFGLSRFEALPESAKAEVKSLYRRNS